MINDIKNNTCTAEEDIKTIDKNMFLPFDFSEYFNKLSAMEQLSVGLLVINYGLFLVILNFVSLSFGNYLINK